MSKIAFCINDFRLGGIEKSLSNLINQIHSNHDITIFYYGHREDLLSKVPRDVRLVRIESKELLSISKLFSFNITNFFSKEFLFNLIIRIKYLISKRNKFIYYSYQMGKIKQKENFDIAIAFGGGLRPDTYYVLNNITSKVKFMMVHEDFSKQQQYTNMYKDYFGKFDKIICVSDKAKASFLSIYPQLINKTEYKQNILYKSEILNDASAFDVIKESNEFIICTVGRLSDEKGQDIIPMCVQQINSYRKKVKWIIIGDGPDYDNISNLIKMHKVEDKVSLLGALNNPYPYIKNCDLYIQTSKEEGYCFTAAEAKILGKPMILTNFSTASLFVKNDYNGYIIDRTIDELVSTINKLLANENLFARLNTNAQEDTSIEQNNTILDIFNTFK